MYFTAVDRPHVCVCAGHDRGIQERCQSFTAFSKWSLRSHAAENTTDRYREVGWPRSSKMGLCRPLLMFVIDQIDRCLCSWDSDSTAMGQCQCWVLRQVPSQDRKVHDQDWRGQGLSQVNFLCFKSEDLDGKWTGYSANYIHILLRTIIHTVTAEGANLLIGKKCSILYPKQSTRFCNQPFTHTAYSRPVLPPEPQSPLNPDAPLTKSNVIILNWTRVIGWERTCR